MHQAFTEEPDVKTARDAKKDRLHVIAIRVGVKSVKQTPKILQCLSYHPLADVWKKPFLVKAGLHLLRKDFHPPFLANTVELRPDGAMTSNHIRKRVEVNLEPCTGILVTQ